MSKKVEVLVVLGGVMLIILAVGPKVRVFRLGRERWTFKSDKNM
jgi:hypothetical protein